MAPPSVFLRLYVRDLDPLDRPTRPLFIYSNATLHIGSKYHEITTNHSSTVNSILLVPSGFVASPAKPTNSLITATFLLNRRYNLQRTP